MTQLIPKVIHQCWIGPNPIPGQFLDWRARWLQLHPGWELKVWNDAAVNSWIQASDEGVGSPFQHRRIYEQLGVMAQRIDLLAVEIPYAFGGIYIDCDFEPVKNIEPLLDEVQAFAAWETDERPDGIIAGGIMGCVPGNAVFGDIIAGIPGSLRANVGVGINGVTGPGYRTPHWLRHYTDVGVKVFSKELFYPWYLGSWRPPGTWYDEFPEAYAAHHWAHSWAGAVSPAVAL